MKVLLFAAAVLAIICTTCIAGSSSIEELEQMILAEKYDDAFRYAENADSSIFDDESDAGISRKKTLLSIKFLKSSDELSRRIGSEGENAFELKRFYEEELKYPVADITPVTGFSQSVADKINATIGENSNLVPILNNLVNSAAREYQNALSAAEEAAIKAKIAATKKMCGSDYGKIRIGMPLSRVQQCYDDFELVSQMLNEKGALVDIYQSLGGTQIGVVKGRVISWTK